MPESTQLLRFYLNDQRIELKDFVPTQSLLAWLREDQHLTGTKEGCAEGDCGACTVVIGERNDNQLQLRSVNACIQFLPTLHGKLLYTVEYLKQQTGELHPVQQAMVDCHGSQCGFCTPGFIMSLWNYYEDKQATSEAPNRQELVTHLSGNLCRCTGYRPILDAGVQMFEPAPQTLDRTAALSRLDDLSQSDPLASSTAKGSYYAPTQLNQLLELRRDHPDSTLLAGGTDVGLWVNKQLRDLPTIIYTGKVEALKRIERQQTSITIGAAVSLTDAYQALAEIYPQIQELWERFASLPIRNAGTLGGNLANGSPIGDSAPWLIAVGAQVTLASTQVQRVLPLEDLYTGYMEQVRSDSEILLDIQIPTPASQQVFRTWKVCKRFDSDISAVCGAFALTLDGDRISGARIAFGGMAATSRRAYDCEAALSGQPWTETTLMKAMQALDGDYSPMSDMRASSDYRRKVARNLLRRFWLETRPDSPLPTSSTRAYNQFAEGATP